MHFIGGIYTLKIDIVKTRAFYTECLSGLCPCEACRNFVDAAEEISPEAAALFVQLGVSPLKPAHLFMMEKGEQGSRCMYEAEYPVVGHILRDGGPGTKQGSDAMYLSYTDATVSFAPQRRQLSRTPFIVMRATLWLPWVITGAGSVAR